MLKRADVVVIGSGGLGAATAFYLTKRNAGTVVLVDRHEIGSQTSPRAAGMVSCMRKGEVMMRLIKVAAAALQHFAEETGQPLDWVHSGSLKVARRTEDAEVIQADIARGLRLGMDVEQITLAEAHRLNPFLQTEGVAAVMRVGDDMYFDPAQVAVGFARGAEARGVRLMPSTSVTSVRIASGRVEAVETDKGAIATRVVVGAAGAWTRQVAAASGIRIPLTTTSCSTFLSVTRKSTPGCIR
jgi:4-methylaminobutanoate oxidase (formaldehyde-forming)